MNTLKSHDNRGGILQRTGTTLSALALAGGLTACTSSDSKVSAISSSPVPHTSTNTQPQPAISPRPNLHVSYPACDSTTIEQTFPTFKPGYEAIKQEASAVGASDRISRNSAAIFTLGAALMQRNLLNGTFGYFDKTKNGYFDLVVADQGNNLTARFLKGKNIASLCTAISVHVQRAGGAGNYTFDIQGLADHKLSESKGLVVNTQTRTITPDEAADTSTVIGEIEQLLPNVKIGSQGGQPA